MLHGMVFPSCCSPDQPAAVPLRMPGEAGGRAGGSSSNRWPFVPGVFPAVCCADGGVSDDLRGLACSEGKFAVKGMAEGCR